MPRSLYFALAVSLFLPGCTGFHERALPALRTGARAVCDPSHPLVIDIFKNQDYRINGERGDSSSLADWLHYGLSREPGRRVVIVRVDPSETAALRWLIPAIEASGGEAFASDTVCAASVPNAI